MASRRIPISSSSTSSRRVSQPQEPSRYSSSLDAVFSYQRSAGFLQQNLQSGPSFVDRSHYPRPYEDEDDSDEEERLDVAEQERRWRERLDQEDLEVGNPGERERDQANAATWARPQEYGDANTDSDSGPPSGLLVDTDYAATTETGSSATGSHTMPPNARYNAPRAQARAQNKLDAVQTGEPSERSPLLLERTRTRNNGGGGIIDGGPSSSFLSIKSSSGFHERDHARRASVFSREAWKAKIEEHRGESTWGQTLFNTVNVLIGVGLLADPLAFADAGWIFGTILLLFCALITNYTAKMLAAMMRQDRHASTYADVLIKAYGAWSRPVILALFVLELLTFSVATVELFADSMASLYPRIAPFTFKVVSFAILVPTTFLPLRILSLTSLLGIMSSFILLAVIIADGSIKREAPGSLWEVMPTSWSPRWRRFPLSFGLLMSGFSGHAVVPSLYRDMAHPDTFNSMINVAYIFAFVVTMLFAALGYLMFGNGVSSEITRDLARTPGYPVVLNKLAVWMVAINPLVKYAIANKPLVQTFEHLVGSFTHASPPAPPSESESAALLTASSIPHVPPPSPAAARRARILRYVLYRPLLTLACVVCAILIPEFDRVLAFLGSASAFIICVIGPVGAYLIIGRKRPASPNGQEHGLKKRKEGDLVVQGKERALCWFLLVLSAIMAATGTVWSFLPIERPAA